MPQALTQEQITEKLRQVKFPNLSRDIVSFGLIKGIEIQQGLVRIRVQVTSRDRSIPAAVEKDISNALRDLPGVQEVHIDMNWTESSPPQSPHSRPPSNEPLLPQVGLKIAVASGKGGVGKSTVAAGLALMMQKSGFAVGLVDFDIYGPSVPTIMGIHQTPKVIDGKIIPLDRDGLKLMSMGFLVDPGTPMIWRGPMVHQATEQFLRDVDWGKLDVLVVDLPPGTGDAQMTLSQTIKLDGAVIVSTPQDLALIDARKGVAMFQKLNVPILGIVENMSGFTCPHCGETTHIFGRDGAAKEARKLNVPLLGTVPLVPALVKASDDGDPASAIEADAVLSETFTAIGAKVMEQIGLGVAG